MLSPEFRGASVSIAIALLAQTAAGASFSIIERFSTLGTQAVVPTMSADGSTVGYAAFTNASGFDSLGHQGDFITGPAFSADGSIAMGGVDHNFYRRVGSTETFLGGGYVIGLSGDGQRYVGNENFGSDPFVADYAPGTPVSTPLVDLAGGLDSARVFAISGNGNVIVGHGATGTGPQREAVRWDPTGAPTGLGDLSGGDLNSTARGVSYDGHTIVGTGTSAAGSEAVRWVDGAIESLGLNPGSVAQAASGDGSRIVGWNRVGFDSRAFLYDSSGAHDLEALLTGAIFDAGLDPDTLDLFSADAISTNGTTIVGLGLHFTDGAGPDIVVWKAVIPEPHTGALVAVGLLAFAVHRRRR